MYIHTQEPTKECSICNTRNFFDRFTRDYPDKTEHIIKCRMCGHETIESTTTWYSTAGDLKQLVYEPPTEVITF